MVSVVQDKEDKTLSASVLNVRAACKYLVNNSGETQLKNKCN